jgi:hypothetical protein
MPLLLGGGGVLVVGIIALALFAGGHHPTPTNTLDNSAANTADNTAVADNTGPAGVDPTATLPDILSQIPRALVAQGPVAFEGFAHDSNPPAGTVADWTYTKRMEYTAFTNDLSDCQLNFHFKLIVNGDTSDDKDAGVPLRILTAIKVAPEVDLLKIRDAQAGHPTYSSRLQPQIYDIDLIRNNGGTNEFSFYDEEAARRVARLFELAAERCGVTSISHY